ncbi:uncharacterized protein LODBEIA_P34180 [Lodderomyces beijingensis]|uniref:PI31 proteasome regulator C-terminal domain-containing protein n=1 Tax=Lodderomyces beijingensis TaxID=1775926 RepID=A0ABP0ZM36_9ASCO
MAIENYFQLTYYLVSEYVSSIYPERDHYKTVQTADEAKLKQVELYYYDEKFLILSFTAISQVQSLVNLLNIDGRLDNALINWEWFDLDEDEIKFPLADTTTIPQSLVEKFQQKFRRIVDDEKPSSIFNSSTPGQKQKEKSEVASGPIVEEHTDTESNFAKSPTPEEPYHPAAVGGVGGSANIPGSAPQPQQQSGSTAFRRPADMPDFEDEYQIRDPGAPTRDTLGQSTHFPPVGADDLNPPGIPQHPTLQGYLDPLGNRADHPSGMYPDAQHPIFHPQQGAGGASGRKGVPPGARYDDPYSEDNLDALGQGLPGGGLRGPGSGGGFGNFGPPGGGGGF